MGDKKSGEGANFGARLLIVFYALGIVAIGMRPIQREYGSVWKFLEITSKKMNVQNPFPGVWEGLTKGVRDKPPHAAETEPAEKSVDKPS